MGIFRYLICLARGPRPPPPTRYDAAPCRGCLLPNCDPSTAGAAAAPRMSSEMNTSGVGGRGVDNHKSEKSLLSFAISDISHHLRNVGAERSEAMEGLLTLLYDKVDSGVSRPDLSRIFVDLGGAPEEERG